MKEIFVELLNRITLTRINFKKLICHVFVITISLTNVSYATQSVSKVNVMENEVIDLISRLSINEESQHIAFNKLKNLSCEYTPFIIKHMDDRRRVVDGHITFENVGPGHFEGLRHIGVVLVIDALDALLNQKTGLIGYSYDYGEATDENRKLAVEGWKAILNKYHGNLCPEE